MFKEIITKKLEKKVKKYFENHPDIKLIAVAGSVGKTSTKLALANILSTKYKVRLHRGNHNTHLSGPLAILGIDFPGNPHKISEWLRVFKAANKRIKAPAESEPQIIIQELGTDSPGDIDQFGKYLLPDIAIITAITPEHMEFFGNISAVAREELSAVNFSKTAIINRDDVSSEYSNYINNPNISTYGENVSAEYSFEFENFTIEEGYSGKIVSPEYGKFDASVRVFGTHSMRPVIGAVAAAIKLGMNDTEIAAALKNISPVKGRMNVLNGYNDTMIIDDTYNSSPAAAEAALQALYSVTAPGRIAILGSMNELGTLSAEEHKKLGSMCDPFALQWVITVGDDANNYLASAARAKGCQVQTCKNALEAGAFAKKVAEKGYVILIKGSQSGIFLEEATKIMLRNINDSNELVRQDSKWLKIKDDFFASFSHIDEDEV